MGLLFDNPEMVKTVIDGMLPYYATTYRIHPRPLPIDVIAERVEMVRKAHNTQARMWLIEHSENFRMIGSCALTILGDKFKFDEFFDMLYEKHKLYTDAPIREWNELGVVIRIASKVKRYQEVSKKLVPPPIKEKTEISLDLIPPIETAIDTMKDILGYCILGFLLVRERATDMSST